MLAAVLAVAVSLATPEPAAACVLTTTGAASVLDGQTYTLNLSAADTGDGLPTFWTINWGDGDIETFAGNPSWVTHTYTAAIPSIFAYNIVELRRVRRNDLFAKRARGSKCEQRHGELARQYRRTRTPAQSGPDGLDYPLDAIIGPDGNVNVGGWNSGNVVRYNSTTGAFIDEFVTAGSGGSTSAGGMAFGPDGNLYVARKSTRQVLRYNGTTGAFIDAFVAAGLGGLDEAEGLKFGPDGNLYVSDFKSNTVNRYNGSTEAFIDLFVTTNLKGPEDLVFGPDGNLYVANDSDHNVMRFNGTTGTVIYLYYGNTMVTSPTENPTGVWGRELSGSLARARRFPRLHVQHEPRHEQRVVGRDGTDRERAEL